MKTKHIKKLRKRISSFDKYLIRQSAGLFGDFFGNNRLGLIMDDYYVKADSYELALQRFFHKYERMFKRRHDNYTTQPVETTERWGRIMVENQRTKFIKFYK
jgi:hypothetical protein